MDLPEIEGEVYEMKGNAASLCTTQTAEDSSRNVPQNPQTQPKSDIAYKLNDVPPWYLCIVLGLQHYLTMFGGTVTYPYLIAPSLCLKDDNPAVGYLISTTFFVSGLATFLQTTFGVRLPIVQGSTIAFLVPTLAILKLPEWQCPPDPVNGTVSIGGPDENEIWMMRMREVQGAIIGASLFEVAIGFTGLMGVLLTWITPLAIVPTVTLVGLCLFVEAAKIAAIHWGIAFLTIVLLVLFSQYLANISIPIPTYNKSKGWSFLRAPLFKLFPVLLTMLTAWCLCGILTGAGALSDNSKIRTDRKLSVLHDSPWFRFPKPFQWGIPTFSTAAIFGMLAGVIASAIESIGDYYACARLSTAPPPPKHAINRGIWAEGIGCILAAIWGSGGGVTSYSENIGAIGITKVASRRVIQYGSVMMILFGMIGKFGAVFVTIPEPIIGGIFCVMFAMITAVGLSTLHYVDLRSSRNLFVLGFSLFMGLALPFWLKSNPDVIKTGSHAMDQIITVLLSTSMFVGGFLGFLLDNTIPGTDEERGILKWKNVDSESQGSYAVTTTVEEAYDIPFVTPMMRKISFFQYVPVSPTFKDNALGKKIVSLKNICRKRQTNSSTSNI